MAIDPHAEAALALHRFGMGPRAGSIAAIASDPRGALLAELERPGAGHVAEAGLMTSAQASRAVFEFRQERAANTKVAAERKRLADSQRMDDATAGGIAPDAGRAGRSDATVYRSRFSCRKPKRASTPRSTPSSALSSGWSGSGRTISAFRPTRSCRWRAPTSARRSGRMCSAALPTCCSRSKAIRRCCSISTTAPRSGRIRSPASTAAAGSTRISRAKFSNCIRSASTAATRRMTSPVSPMC